MGADDKSLAERAAEGARKLAEAERARREVQDQESMAQRERREAWLARACVPPSRSWLGPLGRRRADVVAERAWLASLPFAVRCYEDMFGDSKAVRKFAVLLEFAGADPDEALLRGLFGAVATEFWVATVRTSPDRRRPYAEYAMPAAMRDGANRAWKTRLLFHRVVDEVLVPLHREHPLGAVECGEDHHFDMRHPSGRAPSPA